MTAASVFPIDGIGVSAGGVDAFRLSASPHAIVSLKDGRLGVRFASEYQRVPRPIDASFDSLGAALGDQSDGIVLSGTGGDGGPSPMGAAERRPNMGKCRPTNAASQSLTMGPAHRKNVLSRYPLKAPIAGFWY